jgi:hypothetical protein
LAFAQRAVRDRAGGHSLLARSPHLWIPNRSWVVSELAICDGLFIVDSRIALWEIFYLTFAACAYLALFTFMQSRSKLIQRRALAWMGLALGLGLASKVLIPAVTFALVSSCLARCLAKVGRHLAHNRWRGPRFACSYSISQARWRWWVG